MVDGSGCGDEDSFHIIFRYRSVPFRRNSSSRDFSQDDGFSNNNGDQIRWLDSSLVTSFAWSLDHNPTNKRTNLSIIVQNIFASS